MVRSALEPIVIAGPTASGKSALAISLAQELGGELVCADSRQIYEGMQIGSAGPTVEELSLVPHHGFYEVSCTRRFDAGFQLEFCDKKIQEIQARGKIPILVGGTGLYLRIFRFGFSKIPKSQPAVIQKLTEDQKKEGLESLYQRLKELDPATAKNISKNDKVRILRALEIHELGGQKPSLLREWQALDRPARFAASWILLTPERDWIWGRIEKRVAQMFANGLVDEALALRNHKDVQAHLLATMGYDEALQAADGKMVLEEAIQKVFFRHRQYAKRQATWFKKETWWSRFDPNSPGLQKEVLQAL